MAITVFVVDDHVLVRNAVAQVIKLEADLEVIGEGSGTADTVEAVRRLQPSVVVLDLEMPVIRGADFIGMITDGSAKIRTLVCSMHASYGYVAEALRRGADGYVLKSSPSTLLLEGIRAVAMGKAFIDPALQSEVLRMVQSGGPRSAPKDLSAREIEVLRLVAEGLSNEEIAQRTQQSLETVKLRMRRAFQKLGATDRTHAVALALRQNLIQ
ncbi:MAG: response regulator transcription factor [Deltaproteobacteria bacterium]|nr:response regulator transcription factor [Deltaproteobacteria bacterium]